MVAKLRSELGDSSAIGDSLARFLPDDGIPWYKKHHLIILNIFTIALSLTSAANGYDGTMMNGLMALPQWNDFMNNPQGSWLGFINAVQPLSATVAYPFVAYFANRWGRKNGIYIGYAFLLLGVFLQAFAPNPAAFILGRVFLGQPSAWWGGLAPLLITELAYPTHRGFLTALYLCGWYVGSIVAAWATYGTRNYTNDWAWRIPSILQIAIPVVVLPVIFFVNESPRYLVAKGRIAEARALLIRLHAGGDESSPLVAFEMLEIERAIEADNSAKNSTSWMDLISTPGNRHRAFISVSLGVFAQWNGVGVVSYYLAKVLTTVGITSVTNQTLISACLQIWNLVISIGGAACVDRVGRRPLFIYGTIGMLVSFILISGLSGSFANTGNHQVGIAVVPFLYIYYGFYDVAL
ncbi:hypothetical protein SEUCBS139899_005533 [Sporothrix eucalyptigena]|uniref:Major facilitator superfamily (MFS) profile domain-containing protein n=1 Tax=Sporothrix eucalyptigena TaxID=1812306 RepID=A0ABP0D3F8_9PEZI